MKSKEIRESDIMMRNQYNGENRYGIPSVGKEEFSDIKFDLMGFDQIGNKKAGYEDKTIHFFLDDTKFNSVYNQPRRHLERLAKYYAVLTPDFSLYTDMPIVLQMMNVFKSRWCGAYWQDYGIKVIPTISWSDHKSYEFCFLGVERKSIVAVSTLGVKNQKVNFMKGYDAMLEMIEPSIVLCYDKPFPEMRGDVIYIDYLSSTGRRGA